MEVLHSRCAGLDVHKKTVVVCCLTPDAQGQRQREVRTFSTVTGELLRLLDWLLAQGITHVAMESTGEYWKPIYNLLEGHVELLVVNAQHMKQVPGRKTDVKDAEWIADLLQHGLLRGSFIPPLPQRDLRDLTRQRANLMQDRATVINRLHKTLEWANIKLTSVLSDVAGASGRAILAALLAGQTDPMVLAGLARGRLRSKHTELEAALTGMMRPHHSFLLAQALIQLDFLDEQLEIFDMMITQYLAAAPTDDAPPPDLPPDAPANTPANTPAVPPSTLPPLSQEEALALLDTIPGVGPRVAAILLAEIGTNMAQFPTDRHLAGWARLAPGNNESAGKRYSGATGRGNRWLKSTLVQSAWAAIKVKDSYVAGLFQRLCARRGAKRAIVAVAHHLLIAAYHMLLRHQPYHDLGANHFDQLHAQHTVKRLSKRIRQLGFEVTVTPMPATV